MLCNVCNNKNNYSYFSYTPKNTVSFRSIYMTVLAAEENLLVPDDQMALFWSPEFILSNLVKLQTLMRIVVS